VEYGKLSSTCYNGMPFQSYSHDTSTDRLSHSSSNEEAHDTSFTLQDKVDILLADNNELKQRMESFEHELTMLARNTRPTLDINRPGREHAHALRGASRLSLSSQEFEDLLQQSWVYRRNEHREETMSFNSSVIRDYAWSELSKLTLAHLSIISVIALPVKASELADSSWYEPNINTALRALELHISTTASARQVGPKSPERSRKLEIFDEENGRRLQALEARLETMMGWIENELRAEHDEMQKQNLEEMGREMGNAVAKFKTSLRENPGVLQVNGRESNFSSSSTLLASITSSGSKSRATDVLDQELCPLHDGKGSLYNEVSATMRVLDEFNHDPTASTFLSLQSELARKLPLHKRLRLSDPVPTSTLTAWRRIFTREAEVQSESAELLVLRGQMQKDLNNAGNAQSNFRRNQTRPDTPGSNAIALDDQLFSCEGYLTLDLSQRALAELPLGHLRKMKNQVRILVLDDNKISIFKGAKKALGQLQVLRMRRNGLVNIPEELTTMDLQSLDISHNFIEHIPETMTRMKLLQELTAHGNAFAELPAAVWKMEGLEKLYVQWSVWRAWCEVNKECVDWKVIKRYDVGLYTLGWVELERDRHLSFMP
jgi:Leucine-rich repeat (LRR) protein